MLLLFWASSALSTASPSITLSLAPAASATRFAQASPAIVLSLSPAVQLTLAVQAAPSIQLALEIHTIGGSPRAGSSVIELEYNATGSTA